MKLTKENLFKAKIRYQWAKEAYYNKKKPVMSDADFDKLEDQIRRNDPDWDELKKTGVPIKGKKQEVALDRPMASLNKVYPEAVAKWLAKNPSESHIAMDKLDGSALLVTVKDGRPVKAVTRGDGTRGKDISFLIPALNLPKKVAWKGTVHLRCEAVMKKDVFESKWSRDAKGKLGFDNARNGVNGILNRTTAHEALKDTDIVVLGVFGETIAWGLTMAKKAGFTTVPAAAMKLKGDSQDILIQRLMARREHGPYEVDGLVMAPLNYVMDPKDADKPKNITAFKVNASEDEVEVKIEKIIWQVSSHGRIIPKIKIPPTTIGGVTVNHCTAHNAKMMKAKGVGPGAVVTLVRSGGVIPYITGVVKKGKFQPPEQEYKLKGVHFVVAKADSSTAARIQVLRTAKFMKVMEVDLLASKTLTTLHDLTRLKTPGAFLTYWKTGALARELTKGDLGPKQATNIVAQFDKAFARPVSMRRLMVASHCFDAGMGDRKLALIEDSGISLGDIMKGVTEHKGNVAIWAKISQRLMKIKGFSDKTTALTISGLKEFSKLLPKYKEVIKVDGSLTKKAAPVKDGELSGQKVSFTGYRSKDHEAAVVAAGAELVSYGGKTTILLYKDGGKQSNKIDAAIERGVRVTTFEGLEL